MLRTSAMFLVFTALSCKTPGPGGDGSAVLTDETRQSVKAMCRDIEPDGDLDARLETACRCLAGKATDTRLGPLVERYCAGGEGRRHHLRVAATGKAEGVLVMTGTDGTPPSEANRKCADGLAEFLVEGAVDSVADACRENRDADLASLLTLPEPAAPEQCWRLVRMTKDNCVIASPCAGRGAANVASLPLSAAALAAWQGERVIPEGGEVTLCHAVIQSMHSLKDPKQQNLQYNYPFANYLSMNRSNAHVTYGAANCHGTAQALSGGFLGKLPVASVGFHSQEIEQQCGAPARAAFAAAGERPLGDDLPVQRGGYVVNMNHDATCPATACGTVSFNTFNCDGDKLESHVFIDGMCVNCWDGLLQKAGLQGLPASATWRDLDRGCVMTANDHSITVVYKNDGFCYFYESLSPFAPPQLNVVDCPSLYPRFKRRWCPRTPLDFARGG